MSDTRQPDPITEQNTIEAPVPAPASPANAAQSQNVTNERGNDTITRQKTVLLPAVSAQQSSMVEQETAHMPAVPAQQSAMAEQETVQLPAASAQQSSMVEQETIHMPAVPAQQSAMAEQETAYMPIASVIPYNRLPRFAQRLLGTVMSRASEPEPERWTRIWQQEAAKSHAQILGWFPTLLVIDALGIVVITLASLYGLRTFTDQHVFLWVGLLVIFATSFLRMLSPIASRTERIFILCSAGFFIYLVTEVLSPLHFIFIDEYLHLRIANDIIRTQHLFSENSMLPVGPSYPGLEIVTTALSSLSGLNTFVAGLIVAGVARIVVVLSLFMLFEQIIKSARVSGIATMLYMCNAGFFMFDSLFLYEAMGLAVGTFLLLMVAHVETVKNGKNGLLLIACLAIGALTAIHHVSDFFFVGLLLLWTVVSKLLGRPLLKSPVAKFTFLGLLFAVLWVVFVAKPVIPYLFSPLIESFTQLKNILLGMGTARRLFTDYSGSHPTPFWEQLLMLMALVITTLSIPFAALCLWHRYRRKALPFMLGIISLLYPLTQLLRMTGEKSNIADRSSPFLFIGVGFAIALLIVQMWPAHKLKRKHTFMITLLVSIIFTGGNMLGAGPSWQLMPGSYLVEATNARSVDPESVQMALWTLSHLGPDNRMYGDSMNSLLLNAYGEQRVVTTPYDQVDIAPVYYASQFQEWERAILQAARVRYLIVDYRLSTMLPTNGYYFYFSDTDTNITTPISMQALKKFDSIAGVKRIFDSGNIVIYDVGGLTNASQKS